jgi:uncharacterized protein
LAVRLLSKLTIRLLTVLALLCAGPALAQDFTAGMTAHLDKRYGESRRVFGSLADAGNVRAQFMMGTIFEQGLGVHKDLSAAARWYRAAADGGNASAQYNLGVFYQFGKGVGKDSTVAAKLLWQAAEQGHGRAQNNLSTFYFTGVGVPQDLVEAWKWLTLSADRLKGQARELVLGNRRVIEEKLKPEQLTDAKRRVAAWRKKRAG